MSDLIKELDQYPDPMSKTQFCRACHVSNSTGSYLIKSGLVPSDRIGAAKWFVVVHKSDAIAYLEHRQRDRQFYQEPPLDPSKHKQRKQPAFSVIQSFDFTKELPKKLQAWIFNQFKTLPDILSLKDCCPLLGYPKNTVSRWCMEKRISCTIYHNKFIITKKDLIEFIASEGFNAINRKSEQHYKMIVAFLKGENLAEWKDEINAIRSSSSQGVSNETLDEGQ